MDTETDEQLVIPLNELWSLVAEYIGYLHFHNQTSKVDDVYDAIHRHEEVNGLALKPMLEFMSKHGMPEEFPEDGSHFNESQMSKCPTRQISTFEDDLIKGSAFW